MGHSSAHAVIYGRLPASKRTPFERVVRHILIQSSLLKSHRWCKNVTGNSLPQQPDLGATVAYEQFAVRPQQNSLDFRALLGKLKRPLAA